MQKMLYKDKLTQVIKGPLYSFLKGHDFSKNGLNFIRNNEETCILINIQNDKYNSEIEGRFTVNLGGHFKTIDPNKKSKCPPEYQMHLRGRIGSFINNEDSWFEISSQTNLNNLSLDLTNIFSKKVWPELKNLNSEKEFITALERDVNFINHFWISWKPALKICEKHGKRDIAIKIIDRFLDRAATDKKKAHLIKLKENYI